MILTIQSISQEFTKNGDEYYKVTGVSDSGQQTTKSVFNNLQDKWGLLQENATLEFKLEKKGQFWNVIDILPAPGLPEPAVPIQPPPQIDEPTEDDYPFEKPPKFQVDARQHDIHKQVALYCAVRLTCHGLMELSKLKQNAEMLLRYLDEG